MFDVEYFRWLCNLVQLDESYYSLASQLNSISFYWTVDLDENRNTDAIDLRKQYDSSWANSDAGAVCSVFEVMVALANRMENDIMYDCEYENRINTWFMIMIESLGLAKYTNEYVYGESEVIDEIIYTFLDREFQPDGTGSLFKIEGTDLDFRGLEIWEQMMQYLAVYYF